MLTNGYTLWWLKRRSDCRPKKMEQKRTLYFIYVYYSVIAEIIGTVVGKKVTQIFRIDMNITFRSAKATVCAVTLRFQYSWMCWNGTEL